MELRHFPVSIDRAKVQPVVNSENFGHYLSQHKVFRQPGVTYEDVLDLSKYTPYLQEVSASSKKGFFYGAAAREERGKLLGLIRKTSLRPEVLLSHIASLDAVVDTDPFKIDSTEGHKLVYTDYTNPSVPEMKSTPVRHDAYSLVRSGPALVAAILSGGFLLFDIHSHPTESLPSIIDHNMILSRSGQFRRPVRVLGAGLVICPDSQILALPTTQTPLLSILEARAVTSSAREALQDMIVEKYARPLRMLEKAKEYCINRALKISFYGDIDLERALRNRSKYNTDAGERGALEKSHTSRIDAAMKDLQDIFIPAMQEVWDKVGPEIVEMYREGDLEFCRRMAIKMYRSTDMRHFKEFSA